MDELREECLDAETLREMFKSLEHVKILGDFCIDKFARNPLTVYRYMQYRWAKELILSKKVAFKNPQKWEDPFERRFVCGDYKAVGFAPKQMACLCVTTEHGENEAAFWRSFDPNANRDMVQLTLDFGVLLKALDDFAREHNAIVYVEACDYSYTSDELKSSGENLFLKNVQEFDDNSFIKLMGLKRRAFKYEKELRFIIYGDNLPFDGDFVNVPYTGRLVRALKVCPNPDVGAFLSTDGIATALRDFYKEKNVAIKVEQSRLYDKVSNFKLKGK